MIDRPLAQTVILLVLGAVLFLGTSFSPPSLMDDADAVDAQIARNMLDSGDWVSARVNGVLYLEKSPLHYWLMAASYSVFGVHDWAARLPNAFGCIALMWMTALLGSWGFGRRAGFYSGLSVGACIGMFLFTRILIPDALLTLAICCAMYCFLRAVEEKEYRWAWGFWAALGVGLLLKGLLAVLVPVGTGAIYLLITRQFFVRETWRSLRPITGIPLTLALFVPWVALATLRNPPYFDFTLRSDSGVWRGFFWFYFINEHVLRFLNLRYPRDYNTVPRMYFLLQQLLWMFPWSVFLPAAFVKSAGRASRLRLLAVIWIVFLITFFCFSTTQEYYSMPCYPAFAVLAGWALAEGRPKWVTGGYAALLAVGVLGAAAAGVILFLVRGVPTGGDITSALSHNPEAYTLSLGHMQDLTIESFAYLRGPLLLAGLVLGVGTVAAWFLRSPLCLAVMMALLFLAAESALVNFDPYLSSAALAAAINRGQEGQLVMEGHYYPFSSVGFYTNRRALLLNGVADNLVYGAAAPGAPHVFLRDADLARMWGEPRLIYLVIPSESRRRLEPLLGDVHLLIERGGKCVLTSQYKK